MSFRDSTLICPVWPYQVNSVSPQAQGLVAWWPMALPGGNKLFDLGGAGRHATVVSAAKWGATDNGESALVFDGANSASVAIDLSTTDIVCVSLWCYVNSSSDAKILVELTPNGNTSTQSFFVYTENDALTVALKGNTGYSSAIYAGRAAVNRWRHCVFVFDHTLAADEVDFYEDGVLRIATSRPLNSNNTGGGFANDTLFVAARGGASNYLACQMRDVRIYNRRLSSAEVYAIYDPQTRYDLYWQPWQQPWFVPISVADEYPAGHYPKIITNPLLRM